MSKFPKVLPQLFLKFEAPMKVRLDHRLQRPNFWLLNPMICELGVFQSPPDITMQYQMWVKMITGDVNNWYWHVYIFIELYIYICIMMYHFKWTVLLPLPRLPLPSPGCPTNSDAEATKLDKEPNDLRFWNEGRVSFWTYGMSIMMAKVYND